MEKILVIGIAGGSGSGKTTLMKRLVEQFGDDVTVVSHDNYYRRHDELTYEQRCLINYDEPAEAEKDRHRTAWVESQGICVLRFSNLDVLRRFDGVCAEIDRTAKSRAGLAP